MKRQVSDDRILFYVESSFWRLVQVMVRNRKAFVRDTMLPGEHVVFSKIHDGFVVEVRARADDQKKT